jgi:hypothetical protein
MPKSVSVLLLLAGLADTLTGLLLLIDPQATLHLMRVPGEGIPAQWLRFLGAFVFAVGSSYFLPWRLPSARRFEAARHTLASTAWIRLCIAAYTGQSIAQGSLPSAWWSVTATDALLAAAQVHLLLRYRGTDAHA